MRLKTLTVFLLSIILLSSSTFTYGDDSYLPIKLANTPPNIHIEIRPEIELLAGVLSHTSWMNIRGPRGIGNEYFRELKNFFADYKDHQAIKLAEELTQKGFSYDAPPNFILNLGPLPNLEPVNGYSDYLLKRAGGYENLETFRKELVKLAAESKFIDFFQKKRPYLDEILKSSAKDFEAMKIITWLQEFFGSRGDRYHLIFAPAFFRGGGAATIEVKDVGKVIYQIIREKGVSIKEPVFGGKTELEQLSLHEWGHSFVNPALEQHRSQVDALKDLYIPVMDKMKKIAYSGPKTFFIEQVLRAAVLIAVEDLYGKAEAHKNLAYEQSIGFYLTEFTMEQLRYYRQNREKYPSFNDFIPYLLDSYEQNAKDLLLLICESVGDELKEIKVKSAYWAGDPNIQGLKPKLPYSILFEVEFEMTTQFSKQIDNFMKKAGAEFKLIAENKPEILAKVYQGDLFSVNNKRFWGFWLAVDEKNYSMIEPGIPYKLVPKKQNPKYRWVLTEDMSLILKKKP